ncbi:MAG: hypothetical protein K2Y71_01400 [Xanthobacteraceae bacterium]|nr:hypothetical protein [Xanthobacteraceae bacterium]
MRQKTINFAGQRFVYLGLEAEGGGSLERQSQALFEQAAAALASQGLALDRNVVRSRVFGRTREARDVVSGVRGRVFEGQARAATSSYIAPGYFSSAADVGVDLFAMAAPAGGARQVSEHTPVQPFIRHLTWGPMVFLAGMTCETLPTLSEQYTDVLTRAGAARRDRLRVGERRACRVLPAPEREPEGAPRRGRRDRDRAARQLRGRAGRRLFAAGQADRDRDHGETLNLWRAEPFTSSRRSP